MSERTLNLFNLLTRSKSAGVVTDAFVAGASWGGAHADHTRVQAQRAAIAHLSALRSERIRRHTSTVASCFYELAQRDGLVCWYCGMPVGRATATLEHLIPISAGGPDVLENSVLACDACNGEAADLSLREKLELRERKRRARTELALRGLARLALED